MSKAAITIFSTLSILTLGAIVDWSKADAFTSILLALIAIFIALAIHEIGHICGALMARSTILIYAVGPIKIKRMENNRLKWGWVDSWLDVGGYVQIEHRQHKIENSILMTVFGGPLASLLLAPAYFTNVYLLQITGVTSFLLFIVTMLPYNLTGFYSDGYTIIQVLKNNKLFLNSTFAPGNV